MELLTQVNDYSSLKLFDLRSKNGHLLYQILFKCHIFHVRTIYVQKIILQVKSYSSLKLFDMRSKNGQSEE